MVFWSSLSPTPCSKRENKDYKRKWMYELINYFVIILFIVLILTIIYNTGSQPVGRDPQGGRHDFFGGRQFKKWKLNWKLKNEIKHFLEIKGKLEFMTHFGDETWIHRVAYLFDFLDQLS